MYFCWLWRSSDSFIFFFSFLIHNFLLKKVFGRFVSRSLCKEEHSLLTHLDMLRNLIILPTEGAFTGTGDPEWWVYNLWIPLLGPLEPLPCLKLMSLHVSIHRDIPLASFTDFEAVKAHDRPSPSARRQREGVTHSRSREKDLPVSCFVYLSSIFNFNVCEETGWAWGQWPDSHSRERC